MSYHGVHRGYATTTTTGTGTLTIANPTDPSLATFAFSLGSSAPCVFCIKGVSDFEISRGVFNSGAMTLTRAEVIISSNANSLVNLSAGTRDVFLLYLAAPRYWETFTGNRSLTIKDWGNVIAFIDSTVKTLTLPDLATCPPWANFDFANDGSAALILAAAGSDTINSVASQYAQPGERGTIYPAGSTWRVARHNDSAPLTHGSVRLYFDTPNVRLVPYNGNGLNINGQIWPIPVAGITGSPSGLTPGTEYFVYAAISGNAPVLEFSTTGWVVGTNANALGVPVKSGDAARTLVGKVYPLAGPTFYDGPQYGYVLSWYNRRLKKVSASLSADVSVTSGSFAQFSGLSCNWLTWGIDAVMVSLSGQAHCDGSADAEITLGLNGSASEDCYQRFQTDLSAISLSHIVTSGSGALGVSVFGRAVSNPTDTVTLKTENNSAGRRTVLQAAYWG